MSDCEIIKEYWNEDAISFVFKYLDEKELHNAYLVCKSWWKIGKSVYEKRGPICRILTRKKSELHLTFPSRIKTIIRLLVPYPSLCIFATNDVDKFGISEECHCTKLPAYGLSLWFSSPSLYTIWYSLSAALFPHTESIKKQIFTILYKHSPKGFYCEEIDDNEGSRFLKALNLKRYFDPYIESKSTSKYCLIIWCKQSKLKIFKNVIKNLAEGYRESEIAIWGGTTENINICNRDPAMRTCRHASDFFFLFLTARRMEVKTLILDQNSEIRKLIARRFRVLSNKIILKEHSIAFMYTSQYRYERFYLWESRFFKKYFPSVKLFHTVGKEPFIGNGLVDLFKTLHMYPLNENNISTTLLLITYN